MLFQVGMPYRRLSRFQGQPPRYEEKKTLHWCRQIQVNGTSVTTVIPTNRMLRNFNLILF